MSIAFVPQLESPYRGAKKINWFSFGFGFKKDIDKYDLVKIWGNPYLLKNK